MGIVKSPLPFAGPNRFMRRNQRKPGQYGAKLDQRRKDRFRERQVTDLAQRMSPEEARKALAEWAARGGK